VFKDFDDDKNIDDLTKRLVSSLKNKYGEIETSEGVFKIKSSGSSILVVPLGLPTDEDMSQLGITRHTMEDFLVKLLCSDSGAQEWAGIKIGELRNRAKSLKDKAPLNSSKTLIMTLGVVKGGKTVEDLIPEIIEKSDPKSLTGIVKHVIDQMSLS